MSSKIEIFNKTQSKTNLPEIRPGDTVRVHQKITGEKGQQKIQIFEGLVLVRKHGKGISSTITVRKVLKGIGIEKIFPTHSPIIDKIEVTKRGKVRRAKLYYLRTAKGRKARLKRQEIDQQVAPTEGIQAPTTKDQVEIQAEQTETAETPQEESKVKIEESITENTPESAEKPKEE